jgi:biopolymer transport protein ExbB
MQQLWDLLQLGGPIIAVLGVASVVGITIVLERLWALQRHRVVPARFVQVVRQLLQEGRWDEARALCTSHDTPISAILLAGLTHRSAGRAVIREVMQDRGRREAALLERYLGALAAVATVSPLLGLLGTITGMIGTFQGVTEGMQAGSAMAAGNLAAGIWEALVTTAAGLCVAIPTFLLHRVLVARVDRLVGDLEEVSLDLAELMAVEPPQNVDA